MINPGIIAAAGGGASFPPAVTEHGHAQNTGFLAGTVDVVFGTTPLTNDRIVVIVHESRSGVTCTSVTNQSGLTGCTWVKKAETNSGSMNMQIWIGSGATASGTIRANFDGGGFSIVQAYIARGLSNTNTTSSSDSLNGPGADVGPSLNAAAGQHVVALGYGSKLTAFAGTTPGSGWSGSLTNDPADANSKLGRATRNPSAASEAHQATGTMSDSGVGQHLIAVIG